MISVGGIRFDNSALLLTGFGGLMVLQLDSFGGKGWRVFTEKKGLDLNELNVRILWLFTFWRSRHPNTPSRVWSIVVFNTITCTLIR